MVHYWEQSDYVPCLKVTNAQFIAHRNIRGIDRAVFRTDLAPAVSDVTACDDPAQLVDSYNAVMTELLDKHTPLVSRCVSSPSAPRKH